MKRLALLALFIGFAPRPAAADEGGLPLRTLCTSPAMDYCVSFWTWHHVIAPVGSGAVHSLDARVEVFGHGVTPGVMYAFSLLTSASTDGAGFSTTNQLNGPGFYDLTDVTGGSVAPVGFVPGPQHVSLLFYRNLGSGAFSSCSSDAATPCHEVPVPEPGAWLLVVPGMVGLLVVRNGAPRRARRSQDPAFESAAR